MFTVMFTHPLGADLDPWLAERLDQVESIHLQGSGHFPRESVWALKQLFDNWILDGRSYDATYSLALSLVVTSFCLELDSTAGHDGSSQHVAVKLLIRRKAENIEGVLGVFELLVVVNGVDLCLALRDIDVVINVFTGAALGPQATLADAVTVRLEQLVEDVVGPLNLLLLRDTRLLQQVGHNVATAQLAGAGEMDTDELAKAGRVVVPCSLCIAVRLENRVGGNNLVLEGDFLLRLLATAGRHHGQVGDHLLRVLRLSGTGLSSDEHRVVLMIGWSELNIMGRFYLLVGQHVPVGSLSNCPEVWWHLPS